MRRGDKPEAVPNSGCRLPFSCGSCPNGDRYVHHALVRSMTNPVGLLSPARVSFPKQPVGRSNEAHRWIRGAILVQLL
jgi:hypothetical protein